MVKNKEYFVYCDDRKSVEYGLTTENGFTKDSYLYVIENVYNDGRDGIILSLIICNKKGSFKNLIKLIEQKGNIFRIPTPSNRMLEIGKKQNWRLIKVNGIVYLTNEIR